MREEAHRLDKRKESLLARIHTFLALLYGHGQSMAKGIKQLCINKAIGPSGLEELEVRLGFFSEQPTH